MDEKLPHYGREWTGFANLVIEPRTGLAIGLHHNQSNKGEESTRSAPGSTTSRCGWKVARGCRRGRTGWTVSASRIPASNANNIHLEVMATDV